MTTETRRGRALVAILAAAGLSLLGSSCTPGGSSPAVSHVVLVTLDTLRVDATGPYNPRVRDTPWLDALAARGVTFERVYTPAPVTVPAHAALLTAVPPLELGVLANGDVLPVDRPTLAERFEAAGLATAAFVSLGVLARPYGLARGFAFYDDAFADRWYRTADEIVAAVDAWLEDFAGGPFFLWIHLSDPHEPYVPADAPPDTELAVDGRTVERLVLARAEPHRVRLVLAPGRNRVQWRSLRTPRPDDRPETGLRLRLFDQRALEPYAVGPLPRAQEEVSLDPAWEILLDNPTDEPVAIELAFAGRLVAPSPSEAREGYRREVAAVDAALAAIEERLDAVGIGERVLWAVVSDHGEGLYRHDALGHAEFVWEDQLRALWLLAGPGVPRARRVEEPVGLVDVAPTLLALAGLDGLAGAEGRSVVPCWSDGAEGPCPSRPRFWAYGVDHENRRLTALAGYNWPFKWIWRRGAGRAAYRLDEDPLEARDRLAEGEPPPPAALRALAARFAETRRRFAEALRRVPPPAEGDERHDLLRSLGYVGGGR